MPEAKDGEIAEVKCGTSVGDIALEFHRSWSPNGYDRAVELFEKGFYDHSHFFRTVPGFLVQFGISYTDSAELLSLSKRTISDDPQLKPPIHFTTGTISYAGSGPDSRTSQMFFSLMENGGAFGRQPWETPVGKVVSGIDVIKSFYSEYGDMPPYGKGPIQQRIHDGGKKYIDEQFPLLSHFEECTVNRFNPDAAPVENHDVPAKPEQKTRHAEEATEPKVEQPPVHHPTKPHHPIPKGDHHRATEPRHGHNNAPQALRRPKEHQPDHHISAEHVTGQVHHQHGVHINNSQEEEGLTKLSWELLGGCLVLFLGVFILWLRFALSMNRKSRKTS